MSAFHVFRGPLEPLDGARDAKQTERLDWDVRRRERRACT
jgi:hypothetical protein